MNADEPVALGWRAKLVILMAVLFIASGVIMYGVHLDTLQRLWLDLLERPRGEMTFRFVLQPTMAAVAAFRVGIKDARTRRSPHFHMLLSPSQKRVARLREGLNATASIILLGIGMDAIYQWKVLGTFYPVEALDIAILLAFVPYLLLRGTVARIARRSFRTGRQADE